MATKKKKKTKTKTKLTKPTVSLSRSGYKFTLSFSNIDDDADYIYIEREIWARNMNFPNEYQKKKLGAKKNSSWSYTLDKDAYYPYISDGGSNNNKQSNLDMRIKKVVFKVWVEGKVTKNKKTTNLKSDKITKDYKFGQAVNPAVAIAYSEDGTGFTYAIDINDDYGIDDNVKRVATRSWAWLTKQIQGGKEVKVSGHTGKWYDRDTTKNVREKITTEISPTTPVKYIIHAYSAGPGGKSETKTANHIFAVPKAQKINKITKSNVLEKSDVDNGYGLYDIGWVTDTRKGWNPVDTITIQYRDQNEYKGDSDVFGQVDGSWSTAKGNIHSSIKKIRTDDIGAPATDTVRYFRILAEHDGNKTPGYISGVVGYGTPSNVSGVSASTTTVGGKQVLLFKWTNPTSKLHGTEKNTKYYDGGLLGSGGRLRICIFKNNENNLIKTIYYGSSEWTKQEWTYTVPSSDLDKEVDYMFQVRVGRDNLKPGAKSDNLWVNDIIVPAKCTNVVATKQANNTTVEVAWDNPTKDDTVRNGIQVAWSTLANVFETNEDPNTAEFSNGAMTKAYIVGLTAGEVYYFWVRRYEENDNGTSYGVWSDASAPVILSDKPDTPVLTLSRSWVKQGGSLTAQWIYYAAGGIPQTSAQVEISSDSKTWTPLSTVIGEETHCDVAVKHRTDDGRWDTLYEPGDYKLRVTVNNGMGSSTSESVDLMIATNPTCALTSSSIVDYSYETEVGDTETTEITTVKALRSMPFNVNVTGDGDLNLYVYCIGDFEHEHPDTTDNIFSGDCVWTSAVEEGDYTIENISLADNCRYRLQLECVDPDTNLKSDPQYIDFEVHWEHQAVSPDGSEIVVNDDGTVTLTPVKPEGANDTDVCDIYRTTNDGRHLCMRDVSWGSSVVDALPTFSDIVETAYCFCTRTPDGDEAWSDIVYDLGGVGIIINYGSEVLELPWNVTIDDSRTKQGEVRNHLGGTKLYFGQPYISRSQSLKTDVIKIENEDLIAKLYELSRYSNLCYIRTSDGIGYPATIDVSLSREYKNQIVSVSLSATEADGDEEFLGSILEEVTEETT